MRTKHAMNESDGQESSKEGEERKEREKQKSILMFLYHRIWR